MSAPTRPHTMKAGISRAVPGRPGLRLGPMNAPWRPRHLAATLILAAAVVALAVVSLGIGDYALSPLKVADVLFLGGGSKQERLVVLDWRLPRTLAAVAVGCALGLSGALMQSVTRNALASPDILGITSGASALAVTAIALAGGGGTLGAAAAWLAGAGIPFVALVGGLATGAVVWLLAWRRGLDPFRLVLVGIVVTALLQAYINFVMVRANIHDATSAQQWLAGSLNAANWQSVLPVGIVVLAAAPVLGWAAHQVAAALLGRDAATALGQRVDATQAAFLAGSVALAAVAVAAAGPIGFVAFVAPQVALRLCRSAAPPLAASALTGALLLLAADTVVRSALPVELPVGVATSALGGAFLVYLLARTNLRSHQ
ncbi:FecCD family ABC transporter permease [Corynebacterium otitidis]|uniref:Putative siderophore transport system permease protein n=1 Tax=Corynebacterium otitidis ATCC 51513 TaxID=883169 RepID=I7JW08_9CORY|nr:iron ABC transporter permease [Corynebacterium otitidis]EJZ82278.1 hypothetical protein HMPREF9719_00799 [Corynebacterium otitidis ATCC 51513]KKO84137.1 iron ABC transporter [Corynebacterium otitidis]CCI83446.1 putative siderophore transport system permease protein [Corynebacterium otitidis ATCC 51513]